MDALTVVLVTAIAINMRVGAGRLFCDRSRTPLEVGEWSREYTHMDSAAIENPPVSMHEGQLYVYENFFPNYTIRYIHVDNLAIKTCGAGAIIKAGGINTNGVMIVLHSGPYQEIRSIIDIWGTKNPSAKVARHPQYISEHDLTAMKKLKSLYLYKGLRTVNHNFHNESNFE